MLFITGDTHGLHDSEKLYDFADKLRKDLGADINPEETFVIIAGDFGFIWRNPTSPDKAENLIHRKDYRTILAVFKNMPFTTLFLDGNHENFDILDKLPQIDKWGGKVSQITDNVYHLLRGEVYTIDGKSILTIGGGLSVDKRYRLEGESWWSQEEVTENEISHALENLAKNQNKVDIVITHTAPQSVVKELDIHLPPWNYNVWGMKLDDPTAIKLDRILEVVDTDNWYFGHFHIDKPVKLPHDHPKYAANFHALYWDIKEV